MSATGAVIMSLFATIWWIVGVKSSSHGSAPMYAVAVAITVGILLLARRRRGDEVSSDSVERSRKGRLLGIASGLEGLAIFVAGNVLINAGRRDLFAPVVAIIVGVHFFPIARWLPARLYYLTGALLVALGLTGFCVSDPATRLLFVSVGAACILWLTSAAALRASPLRHGSPRPTGTGT